MECLVEKHTDGSWPAEARRFFSTPQTILVDAHGRVVKNQVGSWSPDILPEWIDAIHETLGHRESCASRDDGGAADEAR